MQDFSVQKRKRRREKKGEKQKWGVGGGDLWKGKGWCGNERWRCKQSRFMGFQEYGSFQSCSGFQGNKVLTDHLQRIEFFSLQPGQEASVGCHVYGKSQKTVPLFFAAVRGACWSLGKPVAEITLWGCQALRLSLEVSLKQLGFSCADPGIQAFHWSLNSFVKPKCIQEAEFSCSLGHPNAGITGMSHHA